jgi:cell division septal protein FtsQ
MNLIPSNARNKRVSNARQRKQQHLLDVKIRECKERSRRARAVGGFVCKFVLVVGLGAGTWIGGKEALRRFVWENPDYFLRDIGFTTDGALTREQVLSTAGLVEGRNIFTVDLGQARAAIEQLPQVESAVMQRQLPNRITVAVTERRPIAWISAKGDEDPSSSERSFLIDARGIVLRSRVVLPEYYHLPIISGFETENLVPGKRVNAYEMQAALELVRLNADSTRFQARNIDLAKGYCLVVTDQRHAKITFGLDRIDQHLTRLYRCLDRAAEDHKELQTVNLIVERNIPVTFSDPEAEAAALLALEMTPPKPPKAVPVMDEKSIPKAELVKSKTNEAPKRADVPPAKSSLKPVAPTRGTATPQPFKRPFRLNP